MNGDVWSNDLKDFLSSIPSLSVKVETVPFILNGLSEVATSVGNFTSTLPANLLVPGEFIRHYTGKDWVKGYGTFIASDSLISSVVGLRRELNRLITVDPIRCRFNGATGDVVIGRITEVDSQRWKVDVGAQKGATLKLSAVNLPSGEQRRKTLQDQEYMRSHLRVNDLILAEIQQSGESGIFLLTRSDKFGKLGEGVLEKVHCALISKQASYVHLFNELGVQVVIGRNGWIFISPSPKESEKMIAIVTEGNVSTSQPVSALSETQSDAVVNGRTREVIKFCDPAVHQNVVRMRQIVRILARNGIPLSEYSLLTAFNLSLQVANISSLLDDGVADRVFKEFCSLAVVAPAAEYEP